MAVAGKVAITLSNENDGKWSESVTYDRLTAVTHNNNLYISKKASTNEEPTVTDEFWFLALKGFSGEDVQTLIDRMNELNDLIQAIIDGSTQVGNAKTLDGHSADVFAKSVDLSNYLQKSGGTINGDVTVKKESGQLVFNFKNGSRHMAIVLTEAGVCGVLDEANKVWLWNSELNGTTKFYGHASEDLPLTGDSSMATRTVGRSSNNPLILKNTNSGNNQSTLGFQTADHGTLGRLGFYGVDNPVFVNGASSAYYKLLHTGNKPTGTYNGNGDATTRTIAVGGIGDALLVRSTKITDNMYADFAIVTSNGALVKEGANVYGLGRKEAYFEKGNLVTATTNAVLNYAGTINYNLL